MFIGEFNHSIDAKGRAVLPAKFREGLGEEFIITKGLDGCIVAYPKAEWDKICESISGLPKAKSRDLRRFLFSGAAEVQADKQGRILIPMALREYAAIDKDMVSVGASSYVEIWDSGKWADICEEIKKQDLAAVMDELGF